MDPPPLPLFWGECKKLRGNKKIKSEMEVIDILRQPAPTPD